MISNGIFVTKKLEGSMNLEARKCKKKYKQGLCPVPESIVKAVDMYFCHDANF